MKYLGKITDNKDLVTKEYVDGHHDSDKQDTLVSGTNIKTINNQSLLGSGNISVGGGTGSTSWDDIEGKPSTFPPSAHTHTMSDISNFSVKSQFVVETYSEHSSKSVGTSGASATYNISKSGYYPLGIVGFYVSHANVLVRACYLNNIQNGSATINYYMRSVSGTNTVTQTTRVLWVKIRRYYISTY